MISSAHVMTHASCGLTVHVFMMMTRGRHDEVEIEVDMYVLDTR
jgi:hypothetical protein